VIEDFREAKISLVRLGDLVKATSTYETDIYAYRITGPGNGHDADWLRRLEHHDASGHSASGVDIDQQVRPYFQFTLGISIKPGMGFARLFLFPGLDTGRLARKLAR